MGFNFDNFSNWGNISGQEVSQSGPSAKNTDGNSYSTQTGNSNSLQWGNKNSYQNGVSNSVLAGISFSTNVAATTSTLVGVGFSFQLAGSVSTFVGPKFSLNRSWELSASWAAKYTWVKNEKEYELKEGAFTAVDKEEKFRKDQKSFLGTELKTIQKGKKNVLEAEYTLGKRTTTIAISDTTSIKGSHSSTAAQHSLNSTLGGSVLIASIVKCSGLKIIMAAPVINLG